MFICQFFGICKVYGGSVHGLVKEDTSVEPLTSVNMSLKDTSLGDVTSDEGYYLIQNIPGGKHTLLVSMIGYKKVEFTFEIDEQEKIRKDFYLTQKNIQGGRDNSKSSEKRI